ncbi:MAG: DNA-processing protein DprA, partial [Albidovulum sp.]|uniref:DNA-processing protein DprA n=1 Tax=Albidovulum sp. TaxID=1872424 RepID=UPI003CB5A4AF
MLSYPTPFTPPTTEDNRLSWLRLIRSRRVGTATFWRLLEEYGSAEAALIALPEVAKAAGVQSYESCPEPVIFKEYKAGKTAGARLICRGEPAYPEALADLADAPPVLWAIGDTNLLNRPMVALVGARNASSLGTRMARKLAEGLGAAGITVVSG